MRRVERWVFVAAVTSIISGANFDRLKAEDQVNTYTTDDQRSASVAVSADGDFVIVWSSVGSSGTDTSENSIQGQRYASDGSRVDGEFQINTHTTGYQRYPSVSVDAAGDFVVVWADFSLDPGEEAYEHSIQGQRYASDGSTIGSQFKVDTDSLDSELSRASVAVSDAGDFVVVWHSYYFNLAYPHLTRSEVRARRFASDGSPIGIDFEVNTSNDGNINPSIATAAAGDFVVVWHHYPFDYGIDSIKGQRYASDGSRIGGEFQVSSDFAPHVNSPWVSIAASGDFVVVWSDGALAGDDYGLKGQRYASDGSRVGRQFQVKNSDATNRLIRPKVAVGPSGDFVATWQNSGSFSEGTIEGRHYASDGSPLGGELQINSYTTGAQRRPSLAAVEPGKFLVVWDSDGSSGTDMDGLSVQKTLFGLIFADGFEGGDTTAWSVTVPTR